MQAISSLLAIKGDAALDEAQRQAAAESLSEAAGMTVYETSVAVADQKVLAFARDHGAKRLLVIARPDSLRTLDKLPCHRQKLETDGEELELAVFAPQHGAALLLRKWLPWTGPKLVGLKRSAGLGDRLGLATPGHIRAIGSTGVVPFLAQQSIREMTRTQRTPEMVMNDATWGVFQVGYRDGFGSDADHLKEPADIDACDVVGFTMFTIDPGDHVCSEADSLEATALKQRFDESIEWDRLEISPEDFSRRYLDREFRLEGGRSITFSEDKLTRAAVKYAGAIAHTAMMYRHLEHRRSDGRFELEVSVDETATPTTVPEHFLIAAELKRLGVEWVSLAPRFIGEFEKGIDYKGDLAAFEQSYAQHVAIAQTLGPYKLSLHSGSDKFSVYPIAARLSGELVHLKTAGTSYLEALRVVARKHPGLYRRILAFAFERFEEDKASYHISARIDAVPRGDSLSDGDLEVILDGNDGRQLLHVTYGSVLTATDESGNYRFRDELLQVLNDHEEEHYTVLAEHLGRHVQPFGR